MLKRLERLENQSVSDKPRGAVMRLVPRLRGRYSQLAKRSLTGPAEWSTQRSGMTALSTGLAHGVRFDSAIRFSAVRSSFPVAVRGMASRTTISSGAL